MTPREFNLDKLDRETSARIRARRKPEPKQCYINALHALEEFAGPRAFYVEGWVSLRIAPIVTAHAWLEVDGRIIECTTDSYIAYYPVTRIAKPWRRVARGQTTLPFLPFDIPRGAAGRKLMAVYYRAMRDEVGIDLEKFATTMRQSA